MEMNVGDSVTRHDYASACCFRDTVSSVNGDTFTTQSGHSFYCDSGREVGHAANYAK